MTDYVRGSEIGSSVRRTPVYIPDKLPGEDSTNLVVRTERQMAYKAIAASQSDSVLGTVGAEGDLLESLVITVGTAATAAVSIKDGSGSSIPILPNSPGGGLGVYVVPLSILALTGPWKVTTGAGSTVVATGRFT